MIHWDLPAWISDTQDGGGDILQDGPPEEEEPGDGKVRRCGENMGGFL